MAENTVLYYQLPLRAEKADNKLLNFHLLDITAPNRKCKVNYSGKEINNIPSYKENRAHFCQYPYTPMPPEPHGYMKVNKYDHY